MTQKIKVRRPEDDRRFNLAVRERDAALTSLDMARTEIRKRLRWFEVANGTASLGGAPVDRSERESQQKKLDQARADEAAAKAKLTELEPVIRKARSDAARVVATEVAPVVNAAAAKLLRTQLARHAEEIEAAAVLRPLIDGMSIRRVPARGMATPPLHDVETLSARLREDVERALEVGALKRSDVPAGVAAAWWPK